MEDDGKKNYYHKLLSWPSQNSALKNFSEIVQFQTGIQSRLSTYRHCSEEKSAGKSRKDLVNLGYEDMDHW